VTVWCIVDEPRLDRNVNADDVQIPGSTSFRARPVMR